MSTASSVSTRNRHRQSRSGSGLTFQWPPGPSRGSGFWLHSRPAAGFRRSLYGPPKLPRYPRRWDQPWAETPMVA